VHGDIFISVQSIVGTLLLGVKRPGHEADNSHNAEVKNGRCYTSTLSYTFVTCTVAALPLLLGLFTDALECPKISIHTFDANRAKRNRDSDTILL
jgi:hypothetical protein